MRCLLLMPNLPWPLHGGREINAHHLTRGLVERGHTVLVLLQREPDAAQLAAWPLTRRVAIQVVAGQSDAPPNHEPSTWCAQIQRRWARYFGVPESAADQVAALARLFQPDYVEACGLESLPLLTRLPAGLPKVWLAADEKFLFHLSLLRSRPGWRNKMACLAEGCRLAAYERSFAHLLDAIITVAPADRLTMRWITGLQNTVLCPNGVDDAYFHPSRHPSRLNSAIFWGRLDFEPNITAAIWFATKVWPALQQRHPDAGWWVVGRSPSAQLRQTLAAIPGVHLVADAADIRPWAQWAAVTVLPLRSGSGIKNKLLEAAAMARPIVASPRAVAGLNSARPTPWQTAVSPAQWRRRIESLWAQPVRAAEWGVRARDWVLTHHHWQTNILWRENFAAQRRDRVQEQASRNIHDARRRAA